MTLLAVAQEHIFTTWRRHGLHLGWFLTFSQFFVYTLVALLRMVASKGSLRAATQRHAPLSAFAVIAVCNVATVGLSNTACEFLNYPTQALFKSAKPIPVMLAGWLLLRKRYGAGEQAAAVLMVAGLALMGVADARASPEFDAVGFVYISLALVADALIGNLQERLFQRHAVSTDEMVLWTKLFCTGMALACACATGQLLPALGFLASSPVTLAQVLGFAMLGAAGELFVGVRFAAGSAAG